MRGEVGVMEDDGIELSLELSIGGSYGKSGALKKTGEKTGELSSFDGINNEDVDNNGVSRSDFAGDVGSGNGFYPADLEEGREIRVLGRGEARMETGERVEKNNGGVFMEDEDTLVLETQQFRGRVREREIREREWVSGDPGWKKEKNGMKGEVQDLNISLFAENGDNSGNGYTGRVEVVPVRMNVVRAVPENGAKWAVAPPAAPVAVSDYHSMSHKGGDDSNIGSGHNPCASGSDKVDLKENDHSCSSERVKKPKLETHSSNETSSTVETLGTILEL